MAEADLDVLTMEGLVTVTEDLGPYVLEWPGSDLGSMDGQAEALVVVVLKRQAGFLLAVPDGFLPQDLLDRANRGEDAGPIGASTLLAVPGTLVEYGAAVSHRFRYERPFGRRRCRDGEEIEALGRALNWVESARDELGLVFYSAESLAEEAGGLEDGDTPASAAETPARRSRKPKPDTTSKSEKPKKPTMATLAGSVDKLLELVPNLSSQIQALSERQVQLEGKLVAPTKASTFGLSQPLSQTVAAQRLPASAMANLVATPPPKTKLATSAGVLQDPFFHQPAELLSLEEEKGVQSSLAGENLAKAVLAQSNALTALVGQIASSSADPLLDLGGAAGSSASTRGAMGRTKLQAELACHSGSFFLAVLRGMARRMQPTSPATGTPLELFQRGISGTLYMERFGGFGRHRDLGLILYQIMGVMDFLQTENLGAAKDQLALLAVAIDQAVLDGGKFDLASLLTLQEEPPSTIFVNRQMSTMSRAKAFSPLADQKWVAVALAFVKEMDLIVAKRQELSGVSNKPANQPQEGGPKAKPFTKKKAKGGGKQNAGQGGGNHEAEEEQ
eukprot:s2559_g5.t1